MSETVVENKYSLVSLTEADPGFETANEAVKAQYLRHFDCQLNNAYPNIICLYKNDLLVACTGFRSAANEPLFLEQYLDQAIESQLCDATGDTTERQKIVEIGGLAILEKSAAPVFMIKLAPWFLGQGFEFATCTVTRPVRRCLTKLGIDSHNLGPASPTRVDQDHNAWGRYYDLDPVVLIGEIAPAAQKMQPLLAMFG